VVMAGNVHLEREEVVVSDMSLRLPGRILADARMGLHHPVLLGLEAARLEQDAVGNPHLADIVKER